jgi:hypothetical protein
MAARKAAILPECKRECNSAISGSRSAASMIDRGLYIGVFAICALGLSLAAQAGLLGILFDEQPPLPSRLRIFWPRVVPGS